MFNINHYKKNNQIDTKLKQYIQTKNQEYILQVTDFYKKNISKHNRKFTPLGNCYIVTDILNRQLNSQSQTQMCNIFT